MGSLRGDSGLSVRPFEMDVSDRHLDLGTVANLEGSDASGRLSSRYQGRARFSQSFANALCLDFVWAGVRTGRRSMEWSGPCRAGFLGLQGPVDPASARDSGFAFDRIFGCFYRAAVLLF